jgi:hypothetical protein
MAPKPKADTIYIYKGAFPLEGGRDKLVKKEEL